MNKHKHTYIKIVCMYVSMYVCMYVCMGVFVQCRHLIPALNVWEAWAYCTTARPIATKFPGHGCMDDLTNERSFDSKAMWLIAMLGLYLTC